LRSLRCSLDCRRLRRIWRNGRALFRHLLLQIGGANIENPPLSSSLGEGTTPLLALPPCGGARFPTLAVRFCALLAHRAMFDCSLRSLRIAPRSRLLVV